MDQKIAARFETLEELLRQNLAAINELTSEFRAFSSGTARAQQPDARLLL